MNGSPAGWPAPAGNSSGCRLWLTGYINFDFEIAEVPNYARSDLGF